MLFVDEPPSPGEKKPPDKPVATLPPNYGAADQPILPPEGDDPFHLEEEVEAQSQLHRLKKVKIIPELSEDCPQSFGSALEASDALHTTKCILAKKVQNAPPTRQWWSYGNSPQIYANLLGVTILVTIDTGATPTVIASNLLAKLDPQYKAKLLPVSRRHAVAFGGKVALLGVHKCNVDLPRTSSQGSLRLETEFLVVEQENAPFNVLIGGDMQILHGISGIRKPGSTKGASYVQIGNHRQRFAIQGFRVPKAVISQFATTEESAKTTAFP